MHVQQLYATILSEARPETLATLIQGLAAQRPRGDRSGVSLPDVVNALIGGRDVGVGAEAWQFQLRLKEAIRAAVDQVPGMRFVEGDA
jgi:hypothetical protein